MIFDDRQHAGRELAARLRAFAGRDDVLVLALPRGGVPVAFEVAQALQVPLDVFLVRKLGVPGHEELAMGAIASGDVRVLNDGVVRGYGIDAGIIDAVTKREKLELRRREQAYRDGRAAPDIAGKTVIVIDDGLATGSTMRAALAALRKLSPKRVVMAVPVAAAATCREFESEADDVVCAATPQPFYGVGQWYRDFSQTDDDEVRDLLSRASRPRAAADPSSASGGAAAPDGTTHGSTTLDNLLLPLTSDPRDHDPLLRRIGDARLVLIGESSHGTHEFYRLRAEITRRLIVELGFTAVAVEGDWPDAYRVNRYVRATSDDIDADAALGGFRRFPTWMWRNADVLEFVDWLRVHNDRLDPQQRAGFYGLDLYSLNASIAAVLEYLERTDPDAARRARYRYSCFEDFGEDVQAYGYAASFDLSQSCEQEAVAQLLELGKAAIAEDGRGDEALFSAEQNARLVRNAEAYYRSMFRSRTESWNLRDLHMMETLQALMDVPAPAERPRKIVVWAHNSHLGNARATEVGRHGELNLGQLVRDRYGDDAVLVGFTTHRGSVTAASDWGEPAQRKRVRPGLPRSYEALFHDLNAPRFQLDLRMREVIDALPAPCLQRAIGVIYRPETERLSHYFHADLPKQFDWLLHIDETTALVPLEPGERWHAGEPPETYPSGL